jgi:bifunctional DNA-binding transcriptional regulator/antitoxin component of YhaV-PrlF toxin-antitoxin module
MEAITLRTVRDRYNTRIPSEGLDYIGVKEGDRFQVIRSNGVLTIRKFDGETPEATA